MTRTGSRRQVVRGGAALLGGLVIAGCRDEPPAGQGERPSATTATTDSRPTLEAVDQPWRTDSIAQFEEILERRAKAVLERDEQAFLADLDQSDQELVEQQRMVFANLRQLEFSDFRFELEYARSESAALESDDGDYSFAYSGVIEVAQLAFDTGPGGVAPGATYRYELDTADSGDVVVTGVVPVTRELADEFGAEDGVYANDPWITTPLRVVQAGNVLLAGDDSVPDLDSFADAAETEAGKVEALWGDRARFNGYILFFSRDEANLATWFDAGPDSVDLFEGLQISLQGVRTNGRVYGGEYAGSRIVVNLAGTEFNGDDPLYVIRHELAHAVTARATSVASGSYLVGSPRWAIEGFARWVENLESPERQELNRAVVADGVRAGAFTGLPPATWEFYGPDAGFNYAVSATLFSYIEQAIDRDTAIEFYARVIEHQDTRDRQLIGEWTFERVCEEVLGTPRDAFFQQWAGFVQQGA